MTTTYTFNLNTDYHAPYVLSPIEWMLIAANCTTLTAAIIHINFMM